MFKIILASSLCVGVLSLPTYGQGGGGYSFGGGAGGGEAYGGFSGISHGNFGTANLHGGGGQLSGYNGGLESYGGKQGGQSGGQSVSNDHHGGVSIVGAGGSLSKGTTFDLTKDAGDGHTGLFGGSFISSGHHGVPQGGADEKSGGYGQDSGAGLGSYSSAVSSYDVGGGEISGGYGGGGHDSEVSPVLYSSYKGTEHGSALNLESGGGDHHFGGGEGGGFGGHGGYGGNFEGSHHGF